MAAKAKKNSLAEELRALMERADLEELEGETARQQMLLSVIRKAVGGDLKTIEFILELLGETPQSKGKAEQAGLTIRLGPGMEEISR